MNPQAHYDSIDAGSDQAARRRGPAIEMKKFHNAQKLRLLQEFVSRGASVLDVACGRGGDLWKYCDLGVAEVVGVDVSAGELAEATRRASVSGVKFAAEHRDMRAPVDFGRTFDVATCMFALQYFWESEQVAHAFFDNVARHVRRGGVFVGIVPDGRCVRDTETPAFRIRVDAEECACFGAAYRMTIEDTVLARADHVCEYAVFSNVLEKVARTHGFEHVDLPWLTRLPGRVLWHFDPPYDGPWRECTLLYGAFAFRKC